VRIDADRRRREPGSRGRLAEQVDEGREPPRLAADDRERHGRPREPARSHALGCARREQQLELLGEQLVVVVESPS
jgi:hypothetical protein